MIDLRLPKLPDRKDVKITITASAELNRDLLEYAEAYESSYGVKETVAELIPYMLAEFIGSDSTYKKMKSARAKAGI